MLLCCAGVQQGRGAGSDPGAALAVLAPFPALPAAQGAAHTDHPALPLQGLFHWVSG